MNLSWQRDVSGAYSATDRSGNKFYMSANQECVTVVLPDGRHGQGWTPEAALKDAISATVITGNHFKVLVMTTGPEEITRLQQELREPQAEIVRLKAKLYDYMV